MSDLDYMLPFEREIYVEMLNKHINEQNEKAARG